MTFRPTRACAVLLALTATSSAAVGAESIASAQPAGADFDPASSEWNGLSRLMQLAGEIDVAIEPVARLDVGTISRQDALLLLAPANELPATSITDFLRAGGRVALADDYGRGQALLSAFRIGRGRPDRDSALKLRGNSELLVARRGASHPLNAGVEALVTNHPQIVFHGELQPIFAFGEHDPLVLAGAVGEGRLVAIGDPSVLINNMLELGSNRRFAANLLRYLHEDGGRIFVVPPQASVVGRFGEPGADRPLHDVRAFLERLASADVPAPVLRIAGAALAGIFLVLAAGVLPRASPYVGAAMFARPGITGGYRGRIEWFAERPANLADALMVYKLELEIELHRRLDLVGRVGAQDVIDAMRRKGLEGATTAATKRLLEELASIREEVERGSRGDALPEAQLRRIVETGDRILSELGDASA